MNSKDIQSILLKEQFKKGHSPIVQNFQGEGLGECDVISISKSLYVYEYEIKISRSDFKADFTKEYKHKKLKQEVPVFAEYNETKKGKLTGEKYRCISIPNYFYYVCPKNLIRLEEIPYYAGLIYITNNNIIEIIKSAPKLHKEKATNRLLKAISHRLTAINAFGCSLLTYKNNMSK